VFAVIPGAAAFAPVFQQLAAAMSRGQVSSSKGVSQKNQVRAADPVDPATGQLIYTHVDLHLDGGGMAFEFARTYRSGGRYPNGPLGVAWDYSLNLYLREITPDAVVASSGEFREDRYIRTTPPGLAAEYFAPPNGFHATLERITDLTSTNSFVLTRPDGLTYRYEQDSDSDPNPKPGLHRIERIVDRFGNQLLFEYDPNNGQLSRVLVNDPARRNPPEAAIETRFVWFDYDDLGRIIAVHDSTGRTVRYTYDDYDDLISVTLPATRDYPFGRTTFYEYSSESGPVSHQLLSVIDEDGRCYLDVEYGSEEGFVANDRVVRQRDDEGEWLFEYADLEHADPPNSDTATCYTVMARPSGHRIEMEFNAVGNLLVKRETAFDEDGLPQTAVTRFAYNVDGELLAQLAPGRLPEIGAPPWNASGIEHGVLLQQSFGRQDFEVLSLGASPSAERRRAFGNRLKLVRRASPAWPPPDILILQPDDILQEFSYQNPYQQLTSETDPRDSSLITKYHYDAIPTKGSLLPVPAGLTRIEHPTTTLPDGNVASAAIERFTYDTLGRRTLITDAEGHKTRHDYFGPADFAPADDDPKRSVTTDGYLKSVTVGVGEIDATTSFGVNARGANIKLTDPRGGVMRFTLDAGGPLALDARDLPVRAERVLQRMGASEVVYATTYRYNSEGKIKREEHEIKDDSGTPLGEGLEVRFSHYGDTGQLLRESIGGPDARTWLATRHVYDGEGLRTRIITPLGNIVHMRYDAERRGIATTRGFGTSDASTSRVRYDLAGRKRAEVDPLGHVVRYDYQAFGRIKRVVQVVDVPDQTGDTRPLATREGHTRVFAYDKLGNVTLERFFEWNSPGQYRLLARTSTIYDERARATKIIRDLFNSPIPTASLDDFEDAPPVGAVSIETWQFYDGNGKVIERRQGVETSGLSPFPGSSTVFAFDAAGRQTSATIRLLEFGGAVVGQTTTTYDLNGNAVRIDRIDNELDAVGNVVAQELIASGAEFDSLNRKTVDIDGLGNRTIYRYDSRNLLIECRDARGNAVSYEYDRYGRRITRTEYIDPSNPIIIRYKYNDDGQLVALLRQDVAGRTWSTGYDYDALHRRVATLLAPNSPFERRYGSTYDAGDNLVSHTRPNKLHDARTYDALNRLLRVDYSSDPSQPVIGTSFEQFSYDGLGRVLQASTDVTTVKIQFDSLGRPTVEHQTFGASTATLTREFDTLGNRTTLVYFSGRTIRASYDSASRLMAIDDVIASPVGAPAGGPRRILQREWIGTTPRRDTFANRFFTTYSRDAAGRRISFDHSDSTGTSRLWLLRLFDPTGNCAQDWQLGSEVTLNEGSIAYTYDGVNWLTGAGRSSQIAPALARPILPPLPPAIGAAPALLTGQTVVNAAVGTPDLGLNQSYTYDAGGNLANVDPLDRDVLQIFDLDGNLIDAAKVRQFDVHDRLLIAEGGFASTYDALGRRVALDDGTTKRRYLYEGNTEIAEYDAFGLSTLVSESVNAAKIDERIELARGGHTYLVHRDHVGSTRMISDESGSIQARFDFDPYGVTTQANDSVGVRYRFMGREWESSLGLYHFRARHYDFKTARFLQRDPAESTPDRSAYQAFAGNPLVYVDPMGAHNTHAGDTPVKFPDVPDRIILPQLEDIVVRPLEAPERIVLPQREDIVVRPLEVPERIVLPRREDITVRLMGKPESSPFSAEEQLRRAGSGPFGFFGQSDVNYHRDFAAKWPIQYREFYLGYSWGLSVEASFILSPLSGGGGTVGLNLQHTVDSGWGLYYYYTRAKDPASGFSVGLAAQFNNAFGHGAWSGPFDAYSASVGPFGFSQFRTTNAPAGDPNQYRGYGFGFALGPPSLAGTRTKYVPLIGGR